MPLWLETSREFGTIAETDGPVEGSVRMVNVTDRPVTVERVRTTCGCTSVTWPDAPIQPGDTATIGFTYNPAGRPGRIDKRLKVYIEGCDDPREIRLTGFVIPSEETLSYSYPIDCGDLRLGADVIDAGVIHPGVARHLFVYLYNRGAAPLIVAGETPDPRLRVSVTPDTLQPGESGTLVIQWLMPQGVSEGEASAELYVTAHDESGKPTGSSSLPHRIALRGDIRHPQP